MQDAARAECRLWLASLQIVPRPCGGKRHLHVVGCGLDGSALVGLSCGQHDSQHTMVITRQQAVIRVLKPGSGAGVGGRGWAAPLAACLLVMVSPYLTQYVPDTERYAHARGGKRGARSNAGMSLKLQPFVNTGPPAAHTHGWYCVQERCIVHAYVR